MVSLEAEKGFNGGPHVAINMTPGSRIYSVTESRGVISESQQNTNKEDTEVWGGLGLKTRT